MMCSRRVGLGVGVGVIASVLGWMPGVAAGFDLWEVQITTFNTHIDGVPADGVPYGFEIWVDGDFAEVGRIEAGTPAGSGVSVVGFELDPGNGTWNTEIPVDYVSLESLRADYGVGDYTIDFYDHGDVLIDSVTLDYDPPLPSGFVTITAPVHLAEDVPVPAGTFTWTDPSGLGGVYLDVELDVLFGELDERVDASFHQTVFDTAFETDVLQPGRGYWFDVSVGTAVDGLIVDGEPEFPVRSSDGGDSFVYVGSVKNEQSVFFTTVPEPGVLGVLVFGGAGLVAGVRRPVVRA